MSGSKGHYIAKGMMAIKTSPLPWSIINNSWQFTTIVDANGNNVCEFDLERFEDLNEDNQAEYENIQRNDAEMIIAAVNVTTMK